MKHLAEAVGIYKANKDLKKAVKYLVAQRFISDTPHEIANFLRVYKNKFDAGEILCYDLVIMMMMMMMMMMHSEMGDEDEDEYVDKVMIMMEWVM